MSQQLLTASRKERGGKRNRVSHFFFLVQQHHCGVLCNGKKEGEEKFVRRFPPPTQRVGVVAHVWRKKGGGVIPPLSSSSPLQECANGMVNSTFFYPEIIGKKLRNAMLLGKCISGIRSRKKSSSYFRSFFSLNIAAKFCHTIGILRPRRVQ